MTSDKGMTSRASCHLVTYDYDPENRLHWKAFRPAATRNITERSISMGIYEQSILNAGRITMSSIIDTAKKYVPAEFRGREWNCPGLNRGKGILEEERQLNCYLAAYGLMHAVKMKVALGHLPEEAFKDGFEVVDWGCGQGLATVCLLEHLASVPTGARPASVTLVDASSAALGRAVFHVRSMLGTGAEVNPMQVRLDSNFVRTWGGTHGVTVHLLSNIVDVEGVDKGAIARAINASGGENYVVCVGHAETRGDAEMFRRMLGAMDVLYTKNAKNKWPLPNGHWFGYDLQVFHGYGTGAEMKLTA